MKKKRVIAALAAPIMAVAVSSFFAGSSAIAVRAEVEEEQTSLVSSEASSEEAKTSVNLIKDEDEDGIPDALEDYYDEHIRDQYMFGISLGAVISFAVSLFGWLIVYQRNRKMGLSVRESVTASKDELAKIDLAFAEMAKESADLANAISEVKKAIEEVEGNITEASSKLEKYSEIVEMIKAIALNQEELAKTKENIVNGTLGKVGRNNLEAGIDE